MRVIQTRDPEFFFTLYLGSEMEKFGSGINIPDPQHWLKTRDFLLINTAGESCVKYLNLNILNK
jgi:hypothetical protein